MVNWIVGRCWLVLFGAVGILLSVVVGSAIVFGGAAICGALGALIIAAGVPLSVGLMVIPRPFLRPYLERLGARVVVEARRGKAKAEAKAEEVPNAD